LSTIAIQPNSIYNWKHEVSLRLAAHQSRKGRLRTQPAAPVQSSSATSSLAALAAARVAARYAQAPSYNQMQAAEIPIARRMDAPAMSDKVQAVVESAAETKYVVAESIIAGPILLDSPQPVANEFNFASVREPEVAAVERAELQMQPEVPPDSPRLSLQDALPDSLESWENEFAHECWEPDSGLRPIEQNSVRAVVPLEFPSREADHTEQPVYANLITFPREAVAGRKMRPRRTSHAVEEIERQLSIFEVDPGPIQTADVAPAWPEPAWSGIRLATSSQEETEHEERAKTLTEVHLAPFAERLTATMVDGALISAAFLGLALAVSVIVGSLPANRIMEAGAAATFLLIGLLYHAYFLVLDSATPGMRCAGISFCTFDERIPTAGELRNRLGAMLLSVAPLGLGVAWALFDDDHLSWHDRLSRTYLRKE
jgi:uncharacterized RDD family membrane protein YckC